MATIADIVQLRDEVLEANIQGIVSLHDLFAEEETFEKDTARVLEATYPSAAMRELLHRLGRSLGDENVDRKGNFIVSGGYGTGKSHLLLALYHILNSPQLGRKWLKAHNIEFDPPEDVEMLLMPMMNLPRPSDGQPYGYLWGPIFDHFGYEGFVHDGNNFPTVQHLREAIGEQRVLVILDEIERWHSAIADLPQRNANLGFLQNLLEYAEDVDHGVFVFLSLLELEPDVVNIVQRVDRFDHDLTQAPDRKDIVLHRLVKSVDRRKVKGVVRKYLDVYRPLEAHIQIGNYDQFEQEMIASYPFHPHTISLVFEQYTSVAKRSQLSYQNSRGAMFLLAHVLQQAMPEMATPEHNLLQRDLVLAGDIDLLNELVSADLSDLSPDLVQKAYQNMNLSRDVELASPILSTILLHSLGSPADERHLGAEFSDILIGVLAPQTDGFEGRSANNVQAQLAAVEPLAINVHHLQEPERWVFKPEVSIVSRIEQLARQVPDEKAAELVVRLVRDQLGGDDRVCVLPTDDIPDRKDISFVVLTRYLEPEDIVSQAYHGKSYPNALVIINPQDRDDLLRDENLLWMAKMIEAAGDLKGRLIGDPSTRQKVQKIADDRGRALQTALQSRYGFWMAPIYDEERGELTFRATPVALRKEHILGAVEARYDLDRFKRDAMQSVESRETTPPTVGDIRTDFYRQRSFAKPVHENRIDEAIADLIRGGGLKAVLGGGKQICGKLPGILQKSWTIALAGPDDREGIDVAQEALNYVRASKEPVSVESVRKFVHAEAFKHGDEEVSDDDINRALVHLHQERRVEIVGVKAPNVPLAPQVQVQVPPGPDVKDTSVSIHGGSLGAAVTEIVQSLNKTDRLSAVRVTMRYSASGSEIIAAYGDMLGLERADVDPNAKFELSWSLTKAPITNRDELVGFVKGLHRHGDGAIDVTLQCERTPNTGEED